MVSSAAVLAGRRSSSFFKSALLEDALVAGECIERWSLSLLGNLHETNGGDSGGGAALTCGPAAVATCRTLLEDVCYRLARQHSFVTDVKEALDLEIGLSSATSSTSHIQQLRSHRKKLETLEYIHFDTYKLSKQLLLPERQEEFWDPSAFKQSKTHVVTAIMEEIRCRHANTLENIADLVTCVRSNSASMNGGFDLLKATDTFLQGRLGVQLTCDHHVKIFKSLRSAGVVSNVTDNSFANDILEDAITEAQHMCDAHLQLYPETRTVHVSNTSNHYAENQNHIENFENHDENHQDCLGNSDLLPSLHIVRPWIHHALVEVFKNAMASSVRRFQQYDGRQLNITESSTFSINIPPVEIFCTSTRTTLTIDVVDEGIGLPETEALSNRDIFIKYGSNDAFLLGHSTSGTKKWDRLDEQQSYAAVRSPLSSLGVGLHSSRCMMEHFGGTVQLFSNSLTVMRPTKTVGCTARIVICRDPTILERVPGAILRHSVAR